MVQLVKVKQCRDAGGILTSKYTDEVIRKKFDDLPDGTIFAAPTVRLADRMESLTGYRPLILEP